MNKISKWLFRLVSFFFISIKNFGVSIPRRIGQVLFGVGFFGRKQLDKIFNPHQRERLHTIIFKSNTPEGIKFDRIIIWAIVLSVITVILETVSEFHQSFW